MAAPRNPLHPWLLGGDAQHALLDVSVVPQARRNALAGLHDGALRIQLTAPPVDGKANAALERYVAGLLGLAPRDVAVLRGQSSRRKVLKVALAAAEVQAVLDAQLAQVPT
jgi:uncharacterized protein (TIGR00251 family)